MVKKMTPTELIAEARGLLREYNEKGIPIPYFIGGSRRIIPALCDELEKETAQNKYWARVFEELSEKYREKCDALEAAQNAQRWIPVAEKYPDSGQEVWICEHKRVLHIRWGRDMGFHPSHWMPYIMPDPPKGE